jgi:hypothetical protein
MNRRDDLSSVGRSQAGWIQKGAIWRLLVLGQYDFLRAVAEGEQETPHAQP